MSYVLPSIANYKENLLKLPPNTVNYLAAAQCNNGSTFGPGTIATVDLTTRGFLDPASLSYRYKINVTSAAGEEALIVGTPAYTFINKMVCLVNSQTVETVSNYNTVANLLVNTRMSASDKMGQQFSLAYVNNTATPLDNENIDGRVCVQDSDTFYCSGPLYSLLGNAEKLIPLFAVGSIRYEFTFESLANISSNLTADEKATGFTISNFELIYNVIDFGSEVEQQIMAENMEGIMIKSNSYNTSIAPLPSGSNGNANLIYNIRYSSVKSFFLNMGGTSTTLSANKNMDSVDVTSGGDYSLVVSGFSYPQKALSAGLNKAGIYNELRRASGSLVFGNNAMAITSKEFNAIDTTITTRSIPGKFWVAFNLEKCTLPSKAFFTGVSTNNSPITAVLNIATATTQAYNCMLIAYYDAIIQIQPGTKQITVIS
jgi:hypothetical protein